MTDLESQTFQFPCFLKNEPAAMEKYSTLFVLLFERASRVLLVKRCGLKMELKNVALNPSLNHSSPDACIAESHTL